MMTRKTSLKTALCKGGFTAMLLLVASGIFSARTNDTFLAENVMDLVATHEDIVLIPNSGIPDEKVDQYNRIVDKYLTVNSDGKTAWITKEISAEDQKVLYPLYIQMNCEQRKKVYLSFIGPLNPLQLRSPNRDEWNGCTSNRNLKIWLDEKEVSAEAIKLFNRKDVYYFIVNKPKSLEERQSYIWTKSGIEEFQNRYRNGITLADLQKLPYIRGYVRFK